MALHGVVLALVVVARSRDSDHEFPVVARSRDSAPEFPVVDRSRDSAPGAPVGGRGYHHSARVTLVIRVANPKAVRDHLGAGDLLRRADLDRRLGEIGSGEDALRPGSPQRWRRLLRVLHPSSWLQGGRGVRGCVGRALR